MMAQDNPSLPVVAERVSELDRRHIEHRHATEERFRNVESSIQDIHRKFDKILLGAIAILFSTLGTLVAVLLKH
jgi:uncharacterized membrane protein